MFSKTALINIILAAFVLFFGFKIYDVWSNGEEVHAEKETAEDRGPRSGRNIVRKRIVKRMMSPESSYNVIVDRILFSPKRSVNNQEEPEVKSEVGIDSGAEHVNMAAQNITLHGIVIMNEYKVALLKSPNMKPGEEKGKWVKIGDKVNNFKVVEIKEDRVLFREGGRIYEALLHKKKERHNDQMEILFKGKNKNYDKK